MSLEGIRAVVPLASPSSAPVEDPSPWSRRTRDHWFYVALGLATAALLGLYSPFLYVLLVASVVVVVTWPVFERARRVCGGRRELAAVLTTASIGAVVFVPLGLLVYVFVHEALALLRSWIEQVNRRGGLGLQDGVPAWLAQLLPADFDLPHTVASSVESGLLMGLESAAGALPALVEGTLSASIDAAVLLLAVVTLFIDGPRLLAALSDLSPLDDAYERRLFAMFSEFSRNVVVGTLGTAGVQGALATLGYALAGVESVVFFGVLTAGFALVPVVGTVAVWLPLAVVTGLEHGPGRGLLLMAWGLGVAQADNLLRPLFLRGRTQVHPFLLLLGVFGGLAWSGVSGALVGPVIVVVFVALYRLHAEHHLGDPSRGTVAVTVPEPEEVGSSGSPSPQS